MHNDASVKYNTITVESNNKASFIFDIANTKHRAYSIGVYNNYTPNCIPIFNYEYTESYNGVVKNQGIEYNLYIVNNGKFTLTKISDYFTIFYIMI